MFLTIIINAHPKNCNILPLNNTKKSRGIPRSSLTGKSASTSFRLQTDPAFGSTIKRSSYPLNAAINRLPMTLVLISLNGFAPAPAPAGTSSVPAINDSHSRYCS